MRIAFKEWAAIVDALGAGRQIIILRKGGIREGEGGFKVEHPEFMLFPTLFHQQRAAVVPEAQLRFDEIARDFPPDAVVRIEYFCRVAAWRRLASLEEAERLSSQHIWRPEVIADRFDWGRDKAIFALAVRAYRMPERLEIPMIPAYGGCKSWVELEAEVSVSGAMPVLDDPTFGRRLRVFKEGAGLEP